MPNTKMQLHVSGLLLQESCGEAFRRRYLEGERVPPAVALLVGGAVHRTVRADLGNVIERQALLSKPELQQIARDELVGRWQKEGVFLAEEEVEQGPVKVQGAAIDKSVRLAGLHHDHLAPRLNPAHVEREFVLDVAGYDFQLAGTIDIQEGGLSEVRGIRDTKTSKRSPSEGAAERSLQLLAYALAVKVLDGRVPEYGALDYLVETKTQLKAVTEGRQFNGVDFRPFLDRVENAYESIQKGVFVPARPDDYWRCSARYCSFFPTCRFALRPVSIPLVQTIGPVSKGA